MKPGAKNTLWYSFGAASSVVTTASVSVIWGSDTGRGYNPVSAVLIWLVYFALALAIFSLHRMVFLSEKSRLREGHAPYLSLGAGFLYSPALIPFFEWHPAIGGHENLVLVLGLIIPVSLGFGLICFVRRLQNRAPNPESCVRPERSGAVNTTHVEQAREDRRR